MAEEMKDQSAAMPADATRDDPSASTRGALGDAGGRASYGGAAKMLRQSLGLPSRTSGDVVDTEIMSRKYIITTVALLVIALILVVVLILQSATRGTSTTHLDETFFPDYVFLDYVSALDINGDGYLSADETESVISLNLASYGLKDLSGVEVFINLQTLDVSNNQLTELDVSSLTQLTSLNASNNSIVSLDVSALSKLGSLDASNNEMQRLVVSGCGYLEYLDARGNNLARLDLSGCESLLTVSVDPGQNMTLPIKSQFFPGEALQEILLGYDSDADGALSLQERSLITSVALHDTQTTNLEGLSWLESLVELDVSGTGITYINASDLPTTLDTLIAVGCSIGTANLEGLDNLSLLDLSENPIATIDLSSLHALAALYLSNCALEGTLYLNGNTRLAYVDVRHNPNLERLDVQGVAELQLEGSIACDDSCVVVYDVIEVEEPGDELENPELENPEESLGQLEEALAVPEEEAPSSSGEA